MHSKYLDSLSKDEYTNLTKKLYEIQNHKCFICGKDIDLTLNNTNVDHIKPLANGGNDNETNFALAHEHCNKSKLDADLEIARILFKLEDIKKGKDKASLQDVLECYGGAKYDIKYKIDEDVFKYSFPELDDNIYETKIYTDKLSKEKFCFVEVPLEYLYHDFDINPRGINNGISKLIKEFYKGNPQLHLSLARLDGNTIKMFDGQHKTVAQILLGTRKIVVRLFLNPDVDRLRATNLNAGNTLKQVAFDKSIIRQLNSTIYNQKISLYRQSKKLSEDDYSFSEQDLVRFFRGENMKKYIIDSLKESITGSSENKLMKYVDMEGRSKKLPISYSALDKTFLSIFINSKNILDKPLDFKREEGEYPRDIEKEQLVKLMNILADEIYENKFDPEIGVAQIEDKIISQKDEDITLPHLIAYRISKEEIMHCWLLYIKAIIKNHFAWTGIMLEDDPSLFQTRFSDGLWNNIKNFVRNFVGLPLWQNKELASSVFSGKKSYDYWETGFRTGTTPDGTAILTKPIDIQEMIKSTSQE